MVMMALIVSPDDGRVKMDILSYWDQELFRRSLTASLKECAAKDAEIKQLREEIALLRDALRAKMPDDGPF